MTAPKTSTWLITGASSGIGKSIALAAFQAGHKVVATSRNITSAKASFPEFSNKGGIWVELDPGNEDAFEGFSKCAEEHDIDVLVNNAGYAFIGGVEDTSEQEVRDQMEVNFYGPLRAVKACLPVMRAKKSGNIVLISSGAGFTARPGRSTYSASKFAIEAIHESLSYETSTLGIKILIVEPGAFRTPFASRLLFPKGVESTGGLSKGYRGTPLEQMIQLSKNVEGFLDMTKGDPDKAANAIVNAVDGGHEYLRMILGKDCVGALDAKIGQLSADLGATREIGSNVDID